jgi:hypothetical protein
MHQTGICLEMLLQSKEPCFTCTSKGEANSCSCHPDVIAHIDLTNESKKRSFSAVKIEDTITTKRKPMQLRMVRRKKYIDEDARSKLTWLELILDEQG